MITLDCGCEYTGETPNLEDPALLAIAFWCPNGHEGMQGWQGTWPEPPPPSRRMTAFVAAAPDGTGGVRYDAPGDQTLAAIAPLRDGTWVLLAKGRAYGGVKARATRAWHKDGHTVYRRGWAMVQARQTGTEGSG